MLGLAVRHGALAVNPARHTAGVQRPTAERRALTPDDLTTVRTAVRAWTAKDRPGPRATTDMANIIDLMLATGTRIGEVLALRWSDIDLEAVPPTLSVNGTIKNEPGKGTHRRAIECQDGCFARVRRRPAAPTKRHPREPRRCRVPDEERHLAAGQQRRTALAADPERHGAGMGDP